MKKIKLLVLTILAFALVFGIYQKFNIKKDYNLLMIVVDTLRADVLSCYGGEANTPNICGLAERGVRFEYTFAAAPMTPQSSLAMFTGNSPRVYLDNDKALALTNFIVEMIVEDDFEEIKHHLPQKIVEQFDPVNTQDKLLAEALSDSGYETVYNIENIFPAQLNNFTGFNPLGEKGALSDAEIDHVEQVTGIKSYNSEYDKMYSFLNYLIQPKTNNFFALKWMIDPHTVYSPRQELFDEIDFDTTLLPRDPSFYSESFGRGPKIAMDRASSMSSIEGEYLKQLYIKEVESVDERVGHLIKALEYNDLLDDTIIVFTSDHGESFGDRKNVYNFFASTFYYMHGNSFYNEQTRVPLIFAGPGIVRSKVVKTPVSLVDLMPTLADLMGLDILNNVQGESYKKALVHNNDILEGRSQFMDTDSLWPDTMVFNGYKLYEYKSPDPVSGIVPDIELYDIILDPNELNNIAVDHPEQITLMRDKIKVHREDTEIKRQRNLDLLNKE